MLIKTIIVELKAKIEPLNDASQSADLINSNHLAPVNNNVHNIPPKEILTDSTISQVKWKCNFVLSGIECPKGTSQTRLFQT